MISQFKINNFRLFDDLQLDNIAQVNLIVGKNSVGKSALLEALRLYFSKAKGSTLKNILENRHEYLTTELSLSNYQDHQCRHIFNNHLLPSPDENGIKFNSNLDQFALKTKLYLKESNKQLIPISSSEIDNYSLEDIVPYLIIEHSSHIKRIMPLIRGLPNIGGSEGITAGRNKINSFNFIPTEGISNAQAARLWDSINLTGLENEVINGLRLIMPTITAIAFFDTNNKRLPLVKLANMDEPTPLKSLGDGMTRIFQIILSLVCSKDSVLLIDEFETGLHWSVQQSAWDIVFKLANDLNVQVFCTTHSRDCIEGFNHVWSQNPKQASFYRIYRQNNQIKARNYDSELLNDSVDTDTEVR